MTTTVSTNPETEQTDPEVVRLMLDLIKPTEDDVLFDLGCGDGRIVIQAAETYGCRAIGVEIEPSLAAKARAAVEKAGITSRVIIRNRDIMDETMLDTGTVIVMYLDPDLVSQIIPKLGEARTIVSISHQMNMAKNRGVQTHYLINKTNVYVFRKAK